MGRNKCIVPGCENTSKDINFRSLPTDEVRSEQWLKIINREDLLIYITTPKKILMCDAHFSEDQKYLKTKTTKALKKNALPNMNLPNVDNRVVDENEPVISINSNFEFNCPKPFTPHQETTISKIDASPKTRIFKKAKLRRRFNLLPKSEKRENLTPRSKRLIYKISKGLLRNARKLITENDDAKSCIEAAIEFADFKLLKASVNSTTFNFINSQIHHQKLNSKRRRFTLADKIFGLFLLKLNPKAYKILRNIFGLPSRSSLLMLLQEVHLHEGINQIIFNNLKNTVEKMQPIDRHCSLMFNEMLIEKDLTYNKKDDRIYGFGGRTSKFADHALVFMARGISKKWKQPIAYYFREGGMQAEELSITIENIIKELESVGLNVMATVCEHHSTNIAAIKLLKEKSFGPQMRSKEEVFGFKVNEKEIIALFDVPHLIKGLRNHFLEADVKFKWTEEKEQTASWKHILDLYSLDVGDYDTKMCPNLTEEHVKKEKIPMTKVKYATQIFSRTVSGIMRGLVKLGISELAPAAVDTADFLLFVDKLYDSLNVNSLFSIEKDYKPLKCAVTNNSPHIKFWCDAIKVLQSMKFVNQTREFVPPIVKNFIVTLHGFIYLWEKCQGLGFQFLLTRNLNQDPLENFFECIRCHGRRNINPTSNAFIASYKTIIINNFSLPLPIAINCGQDKCQSLINFKNIIINNHKKKLQHHQ